MVAAATSATIHLVPDLFVYTPRHTNRLRGTTCDCKIAHHWKHDAAGIRSCN